MTQVWKLHTQKSVYHSHFNLHQITTISLFWRDTFPFSTSVSYRTISLLVCCPALTSLLHLIIASRATGTADHVRSLDDQFSSVNMPIFSRGHATVELAASVGRSVSHIFELRAVFALLLLPNRLRLDCRVSGLVFFKGPMKYFSMVGS